MRQDLFMVGGGIVAVGLAIWGLWGSPQHSAPHPRRLNAVSGSQPPHLLWAKPGSRVVRRWRANAGDCSTSPNSEPYGNDPATDHE